LIKQIYCCGCEKEVDARLTDGGEIYPHRSDLKSLPFWRCDSCNQFVGCHHKTSDRTRPLGVIPTKEIKQARVHIHKIMDPLWKSKKISRGKLYARLTKVLGREYHTGHIKTVQEARDIYREVCKISNELVNGERQ